MKIKKILLFSLLVLLLLGVSYATEANNDTTGTTDTPEVVKDTGSVDDTEIRSTVDELTDINSESLQKEEKTVNKNIREENTKKDKNNYVTTVTNYTQLKSIIDSLPSNNKSYTINLKPGDYNFTDNIRNNEDKYIIIEGNGITLNGQKHWIDLYGSLTFKNIILTNFTYIYFGHNININNSTFINNGDDGYDIEIIGDFLNISNSTFINNTVSAASNNEVNIVNCIFKSNNCPDTYYLGNDGTFNLINSTFTDNAITYNSEGTMNIINSAFTDNSAISIHPDFLNIYNSNFTNNEFIAGGNKETNIANCVFKSNRCSSVRSMLWNKGNFNLINSTFINNIAIITYNTGGTMNIINSTFTDNSAMDYLDAAIIVNEEGGTLNISNSTFTGNVGVDSGVIYAEDEYSSTTVNNCTFTNNLARYDNEGAINNLYAEGNLTVGNSTFINNRNMINFVKKDNLYNITINDNGFISKNNISVYVDNKYNGTYDLINNQLNWNKKLSNGKHRIVLKVNDNNTLISDLIISSTNIERTVNSYSELVNKINEAGYTIAPQYIINLKKGDYNATQFIILENSFGTKNISINGNGITLNGQNTYQFITSAGSFFYQNYYNLSLNNITITNYTTKYGGESGGAILSKGSLNIRNSIFINNHAEDEGGAIYHKVMSGYGFNNSVISNSIFINNTAINGGGAVYLDGYYTTIINNSNFINNTGERAGAILCHGNTKIYNSIFTNNIANNGSGGAIRNTGILTIDNSIFNNNNATGTDWKEGGGAICNSDSLTIDNSIFNNNTAYDGGAIYNYGDEKLTINNSTLNNNTVDRYGGAIYNDYYYGNLTINNSRLVNNTAKWDGGAIYNCHEGEYEGILTITNSIINNNTAEWGGAIYTYDESTCTVEDSSFTDNKPFIEIFEENNRYNIRIVDPNGIRITDKVLLYLNGTYEGKFNVNDDTIPWNRKLNDGQYIVSIKNNNNIINYNFIIGNQIKNTIISLNNMTNVQYSDKVLISGVLTDTEKNPINNADINLKLNNKNIYLTTNNKGIFTYTTKATTIGTNNITVTFDGNSDYAKTTSKTTFKVSKMTTKITLNKINTTKYSDNATIKGKVVTGNNAILKGVNLTVLINRAKYTTKTDNQGIFTLNVKAKTVGTNNVTVTYAGNNKYSKSTNKTTFTVKQPTMIKYANIANVKRGTTVKIVGKLVSNVTGQAIKYAPVTVKVNSATYQLKTDGAGYIRLNYTVKNYNVQKITFKYNGNSLNLASSNSTSFKVKQPTSIKIANMANVKYGSTVKLVGRLLYNGTTAVKYTLVNVTVNGKTYTVKSDGAGYIRLNYTVKNYDDQKITFKFAGNSLYLASSNSTVFKVKQPTWIKHASIGKVKQGSTVKIVGRVLFNGTTAVKYVPVNVTVNGKVYKLKTDGAGYYRLNYTATTLGTVTFISNFAGNTLYLASTNSTKFTVVKS